MKRLIPLLLLSLVSFAPARDKKDVEHIAELEKRVAQLEADRDTMDAGIREAFKKTSQLISGLIAAAADADERLARLERMSRAETDRRSHQFDRVGGELPQ